VVSACTNGGAASSAAGGAASSAYTYKIGFVGSLTGGNATIGQSWLQAINVWKNTIIPDGKINGHPVEFTVRDDQSNPDIGVQQVTDLATSVNVIALDGGTFASVLMAVAPLVDDRYHVPLMRIAAHYQENEPYMNWAFATLIDHTLAATKMVAFAQQKGWTKLAVVSSDDAFGQSMNQVVQARIKSAGLTIVDNEIVPYTAPDSTPQMARVREASPDAVIFYAAGSGATTAWKNLRQVGFNGPILLNPAFQDKTVYQAVGTLVDGAYIITNGIDGCPTNSAQKLAFDALHKGGVANVNFIHTATWAGLDILKNALEQANIDPDPSKLETERARLRDQIEKTQNYVGASGVVSYAPNNHLGISSSSYVWGVFKGPDFVPLDQSLCLQ